MIKHYLQCDTCCCQWHNDLNPSINAVVQTAVAWGWVHEGMVDYCPACKVESAQHTTAASGTQAPCGGLSDLQGEFTTESGIKVKIKEN